MWLKHGKAEPGLEGSPPYGCGLGSAPLLIGVSLPHSYP